MTIVITELVVSVYGLLLNKAQLKYSNVLIDKVQAYYHTIVITELVLSVPWSTD